MYYILTGIALGLATLAGFSWGVRYGWNACKNEHQYREDFDDYIDRIKWQRKQNQSEYPTEMLN